MGRRKIRGFDVKKLFFVGLLIPLTLCSCKSRSNDYKMSKEKYLELFNPYTITLRTNYQIDIDAFGNRQTTEFDNGYAKVDGTHLYHFEDFGEYVACSHITSSGTIDYTRKDTPENLYLWWFGSFYYLFSIPYEVLTFDAEEKRYICGEVTYSEEFTVEKGAMQIYRNKPQYMEFTLKGYGEYKAYFSRHGEVSLH